MIADVSAAFVTSAGEVLGQEMGEPAEPRTVAVRGGPYRTDDVTVVIGLARDVEGALLLSMTRATALHYVSHVMGAETEELDPIAQSGIGELANVIAGRAGVRLAAKGHDMVIMPPTILLGRGAVISTLRLPRLVIPVQTPLGLVELHVATKRK